MNEDLIGILRCPYCDSGMEWEEVVSRDNGEIVNGILKCECGRYPLVDGILVIKRNKQANFAIEYIKRGNSHDALLTMLSSGRDEKLSYLVSELPDVNIPFLDVFNKILLRYKRRIYRPFFESDKSTFIGALDIWRLPWGDYLKYRFSNPTFLAAVPLISLVKEAGKYLLDLGCGMGHTSFVMSGLVEEGNIVCADYKYLNLFLARNYLLKKSLYICLDGNAPLPFRNDLFGAVLCSDALHYIKSKHLVTGECRRIMEDEGVLLFSHMHNSLKHNPEAGFPLTPAGYSRFFNGLKTKVLPEEELLNDFLFHNKFDLKREYDDETINGSDAISIVAAGDERYFEEHNNILDTLMNLKGTLIVNPLYVANTHGNEVTLTMRLPSNDYGEEYAFIKQYLPEKYDIDKQLFDSIRRGEILEKDKEEIIDMQKKFVLLNVPKDYI